MKCFLRNNSEKIKLIFYCLILSIVILLITSKCSFLYPFNDWVDANAFFTVGKGMAHGVVPYKDIFEQKGILLYFIYMIGYLMSNTTFHGVFILEIIFWTVTLYYVYKTIRLFLSKKSAGIILPIFMMIVCTTRAFVHGGSAEEFCMLFMSITMYYFMKNFKEKELSYKEITIAGLCAGCVLLIKFTLLGFWFGFMACIFFHLLMQKKVKKAFLSCCWFLLGMFTPLIIALVYLAINHGVKEFFNVYFFTNMTAYTNEASSLFDRLLLFAKGIIITTLKNGPINALLIFGFVPLIFKLDLKLEAKIQLLIIYGFTFLGIYIGLRFYVYYLFPSFIFLLISIISIFSFFDHKVEKISVNKYKIISVLVIVTSVALSYFLANYKSQIGLKKEDMFQYQFAKIMNQEKNPTMLNMGDLDCGAYTMSGIVPNTYFFELQNLSYDKFPDNIDGMKEKVKNKDVMFVVYFTKSNLETVKNNEKELIENYELIKTAEQRFENKNFNAFLFKVKEV